MTANLIDHLTRHDAKIDVKKAYELRRQGNTYPEIAKIFNCTKQAVHQALIPYTESITKVQRYKQDRAEILADIQLQLLNSIGPEDIKKTPVGSRIMAYGILYDKERLERNKSTANISVHADIAAIKGCKPASGS